MRGLRAKRAEAITIDGARRLPTHTLMQRTRHRRSELIVSELEAIALVMFEQRGFATVTVEEIAAEAQISTRTFYRYFSTKEDVLQVRIYRRAEALKAALAQRPSDEPPLHSLRVAVEMVASGEDPALLKHWIAVIVATPNAFRAVLGGNILALNKTMADFFGSRLGEPSDAMVPEMLAAAAGSIIHTAQRRWYLRGGNLATILSEGLRVLEEGVGTDLRGKNRSAGRSSRRQK
jgi:TetR/AcrR family transcriptional regulator, regulator of mycofactocin system